MKDKVLPFIIGVLIGAIIASTGFMIYINTHKIGRKHDFNRPPQMNQSQSSMRDRRRLQEKSENRRTKPEQSEQNNSTTENDKTSNT